MPAISAHQYDDAQSVLDTIGRQLTIADDQLIEITRAFVEEFQLGLNNYGKDMAMMCVFSSIYTLPESQAIPLVQRSFLAFPTELRKGTSTLACTSATSNAGY